MEFEKDGILIQVTA